MTTDDADDLWYVRLDSGQIVQLGLDALQDAYDAGHIHNQTLVLANGERVWQTLGTLLEGDEPAHSAPASSTGHDAHQQAYSHPSQQQDAHHYDPSSYQQGHYQQASYQQAHYQQAHAHAHVAHSAHAAEHVYPHTHQQARHDAAYAPVAQQPHAFYGEAPAVQQPTQPAYAGYAYAQPQHVQPTHASAPAPNPLGASPLDASPITRDSLPADAQSRMGLAPELAQAAQVSTADLGAAATQFKGGKGRLFVAVGALLVLGGGVGFVVTRPEPAPLPTAAAPLLPAAQPWEEVEPSSSSRMAAKADAPEPAVADAPEKSERFSADMKRALLDADKKRSRQTPKPSKRQGKPAKGKAESSTFSKGGDAYDPLNGTL